MPLQNVLNIITTSLSLYNLCILESNDFDMDWAWSAKKELQRKVNMALSRMHEKKNLYHWSHPWKKWENCKTNIQEVKR